jgi:translocation and assembly module TamB
MPAPYDPASFEADRADGIFHVSGRVFGEQIQVSDFTITRQRRKRLRGTVTAKKLDLGALAELSPALALADQRLDGQLSGKITVQNLSLEDPSLAVAALELDELRMGRGGLVVELARPAKLAIDRGKIPIEGVSIATTVPTGERAVFDAAGAVQGVGTQPRADMTLTLRPTDLSAFARFVPQAERVEGTLAGSLRVTGSVGRFVQRGKFTLTGGALAIRGAPVKLTNVNVAVGIEPDEVKILEAKASVGGGTLEMRGGAPLKGLEPGPARVVITARTVSLPLVDGVRAAADADLELSWQPPRADSSERSLPKLSGDVTIGSFRYVRKVTMTADIESLTRRGHRTQFESYDPANDILELDVRIRASRPLEIDNDLVEAKLSVAEPGLVLSGTNQRFGMRGGLDLLKGGRIRLRRNEFEITQGSVRFEDDERIAPRVDVTAVTDYHRYEDALGAGAGASSSSSSASSGSGVAAGGRWRITMHAYGDPETLRIDLTSEPALRQDDIFLLLTLGLTRAELDRAQSATAGGSVALEALGRLTGADEAVTETIPVIDEFKLGTAYSSRTGRTEPTVTIGKRLSQRIRAYVTSGLSESREVRSNLQWRLSPRVSVEGSYDNVNDISSSTLGNLGTDVRFRLEFE